MPQVPTDKDKMHARAAADEKNRKHFRAAIRQQDLQHELTDNDKKALQDFAQKLGAKPGEPITAIVCRRGNGRSGMRSTVFRDRMPLENLPGKARDGFELCETCDSKVQCKRAAACKAGN